MRTETTLFAAKPIKYVDRTIPLGEILVPADRWHLVHGDPRWEYYLHVAAKYHASARYGAWYFVGGKVRWVDHDDITSRKTVAFVDDLAFSDFF